MIFARAAQVSASRDAQWKGSGLEAATALSVRNLFKVFGPEPDKAIELHKRALDKDAIFRKTGMTIGVCDASFDVREGEIFVVMGLSGSGKSTLVRMLNRLIDPSAGEIVVKGEDIAKMSTRKLNEFRRKHISMVFQSFALMPHMTVLQNAAFGLELSGTPIDVREKRAMAALEQVGLGQHPGAIPTSFRGACSSGWASPAPSRTTPRSCSWTRPSPPSIR